MEYSDCADLESSMGWELHQTTQLPDVVSAIELMEMMVALTSAEEVVESSYFTFHLRSLSVFGNSAFENSRCSMNSGTHSAIKG